jgi:hypothetical protein
LMVTSYIPGVSYISGLLNPACVGTEVYVAVGAFVGGIDVSVGGISISVG